MVTKTLRECDNCHKDITAKPYFVFNVEYHKMKAGAYDSAIFNDICEDCAVDFDAAGKMKKIFDKKA